MPAFVRRFWKDESGQGLPEYTLLVAAVVVLVVLVMGLFSEDVLGLINSIGGFIDGASPA